ncbi:hypothetical protein D187_004036 [Cystobacter fuscus DSM 2262]|uniref:HEAT repeat domain-containing protein n=1 Tax=Cystobacter fuscus (strain ATCC 25194 / DSM 2262 / NBRC 100088 / M29) TaxID=1242864 RepID=S9P1D9_CYSF2|nr:hypothetical protein D187_004036 [Cystobacter fuscus DSM 2262]
MMRGATVLGAAALLAGVALIGAGSRESEGGDETRSATVPGGPNPGPSQRGSATGSTGPGEEAQEAVAAPPRFESTTCWPDLERFNDDVTIDNFREWAAPMLSAREPLVRDYLKERLTELIGNDAGRASQVLGWAREAGPKDAKVYLAALRDSEAIQLPQVAARLMDMSLDGSLEPHQRAGFLSALDTQKRLEPTALTRLANFARDPVSGEAGWAATRTIARVMKRDFNQSGSLAPYMDKLLTIGAESPDEQIRYLALSMPMHAAPVLDAEATERYTRILATEGSEGGREAAVHNLSLSQDRAKVLELFGSSFETEQDVCVRWALFRFAARAAGRDALPVMATMALKDPRFQPDYQAFEQIYASGTLDFVRLWNSLPNQDPHNCLDRHD